MKKIYSRQKHFLSDTLTPIAAFLNLRDKYISTSLFESSDYHSRSNSKSFVGCDPLVRLKVHQGEVEIMEENQLVENFSLEGESQLEKLFSDYEFIHSESAALNGFFGVFAYDSVGYFEEIKLNSNDELAEVFFVIYRYLLVFDNFKNTATVIENSLNPESFLGTEDFIAQTFKRQKHLNAFQTIGEKQSNMEDEELATIISQAKENVARGDVFQLVVSRKFSQQFNGDEFEVYRQLRALNPSPYLFFFDLEKAKLFGASPEAQFKVFDGMAEINPIAGTVKRSGKAEVDAELSRQLAEDVKENAEHTMLVDLARNDLNKFCSGVKAETLKEIQEFSHVIHMVSKVRGKLENFSPITAFGGSFPAGTLSGAPKFKAMELINQYEKDPRTYYGGAIGHIAANGDVNMAIVIRSCLSRNGLLEYQAGAGIVMDSVIENEVAEVENKVRVINRAIELANHIK
ncbi:MAG: anthranilate synthase component I family protein [Flavobacteriales bacterium]|nr:anthranilate synthase component I family protein [Flavobacteriales bacterium]